MAYLGTCDYTKYSSKCNHKLKFQVILRIIHNNVWEIMASHKVCNYIFNFIAMLCLLWLIVLWHLSKATRLFSIACVHYNYKWVTNSVIDFQNPSNAIRIYEYHLLLLGTFLKWLWIFFFLLWVFLFSTNLMAIGWFMLHWNLSKLCV